jgi:hypothetical protein
VADQLTSKFLTEKETAVSDEMIGGGRHVSVCTPVHDGMRIGCGKVDDHPKHVIDTGREDDEVQCHLDCHAAAGCESCSVQVQGRPKGATGQKMLDHIVAIHAEQAAELATAAVAAEDSGDSTPTQQEG